MSSNSDWEKLTPEQQRDVDAFRKRVSTALLAEVETFDKQHPELRLTFSFLSDVLIRAEHPTIFQEL